MNGRIARSMALVASLALVFPAVLVPGSLAAAERDVERSQRCERRGIERVVELRETPGTGLPCEVVYLKPDEDGSESALWMARTDRAFCTARFEAFIVKLESKLDWSCESGDGVAGTLASDDVSSRSGPAPGPEPVPDVEYPSDVGSAADFRRLSDAESATGPGPGSGAGPTPDIEPVAGAESTTGAGPRVEAAAGDVPPLPAVSATDAARAVSEAIATVAVVMPETSEPPLAGAVAEPAEVSGPSDAEGRMWARLKRLLALAPSGTYAPVPVPSDERSGEARVAAVCPPGGAFAWGSDELGQPVLSMGGEIAFAVALPDAALDATSELGIVSSVGAGATRELQTLSPDVAEARPAIDIRVAPRGPGSGALSPSVCRYALED